MSNIHWTFVLGITFIVVYSLVAVTDFLQGGVAWPCMLPIIGLQVVGVVWALR